MRGWLVWLGMLFAGCNGGSAAFVGTPSDFDDAVIAALCGYEVRCGSIGASEVHACAASRAMTLPASLEFAGLVSAGHVSFNANAAGTCLAVLQGLSCPGLLGDPPPGGAACNQISSGLLASGQPCMAEAECASGYCNSTGQDGCPGTCVVYARPGESCAGVICDPNSSYCDGTTMKCVALGQLGADCSDVVFCDTSLNCAAATVGGATQCSPYGGAGALCSPNAFTSGCDNADYCEATSMRCAARVGRGMPCVGTQYQCQDGLACIGWDRTVQGSTGSCGPWLDLGSACAPSSTAVTGCPDDMLCDSGTKKCIPAGALDGSACSANVDCHSQLCDPGSNQCVEPLPYNAACTPPALGQTAACASGYCDPMTRTCSLQCM